MYGILRVYSRQTHGYENKIWYETFLPITSIKMKCTCTKPTKHIYKQWERTKERKKNGGKIEGERGRKKNMSGNYIFRASQPASQPDSDANETAVAVAMAAQLILFIERLLVDLFIYITSFIYTLLYTRDWDLLHCYCFNIRCCCCCVCALFFLKFIFAHIIYSLFLLEIKQFVWLHSAHSIEMRTLFQWDSYSHLSELISKREPTFKNVYTRQCIFSYLFWAFHLG